jgi:hypothetical protein
VVVPDELVPALAEAEPGDVMPPVLEAPPDVPDDPLDEDDAAPLEL